jgi:hypothetical protein
MAMTTALVKVASMPAQLTVTVFIAVVTMCVAYRKKGNPMKWSDVLPVLAQIAPTGTFLEITAWTP